jgi:hypothetical protein
MSFSVNPVLLAEGWSDKDLLRNPVNIFSHYDWWNSKRGFRWQLERRTSAMTVGEDSSGREFIGHIDGRKPKPETT